MGPLVLDVPLHGHPILLIEYITGVNEGEHPVLLLGLLLPQEAHFVDVSLNNDLDPHTQMFCSTGFLCLRLFVIIDENILSVNNAVLFSYTLFPYYSVYASSCIKS